MMQPTEIYRYIKADIKAGTKPEAKWLWRISCPGCNKKMTLTMTQSQLQRKRAELMGDEECFITAPAICGECSQHSLIKFQLDEDDLLVGCLTLDPYTQTSMASPEADPTPGYIFCQN